jgi:uncharacterized protein YodC (DUF2158 family)
MAHEFKAGDLAQLKSGGPQMTVTIVGENQYGRRKVFCQWFDKNKLCEAEFEPDTVEPAKTDSEIQVTFVPSPAQDSKLTD